MATMTVTIEQSVEARDVRAGDTIVTSYGYEVVVGVDHYVMAYEDGQPVRTSDPHGFWPIVHLKLATRGTVRFPGELVTVRRTAA